MKNKDLEKYITELSPELQEKAKQYKNKDELNELLADNDVELSDDALEMVAGGENVTCASAENKYNQCDMTPWHCPNCGHNLLYMRPLSIEDRTHLLYCRYIQCEYRDSGVYWVGKEGAYDSNSLYEYEG